MFVQRDLILCRGKVGRRVVFASGFLLVNHYSKAVVNSVNRIQISDCYRGRLGRGFAAVYHYTLNGMNAIVCSE
jgi:hypothetical protein